MASPVMMDSLAMHPPLNIKISQGTNRVLMFYYLTLGLAAFITFCGIMLANGISFERYSLSLMESWATFLC